MDPRAGNVGFSTSVSWRGSGPLGECGTREKPGAVQLERSLSGGVAHSVGLPAIVDDRHRHANRAAFAYLALRPHPTALGLDEAL
jgi:hypothetical protein